MISDSIDNSKKFTTIQIEAMRAVCNIPVLSWCDDCKDEKFLDALDYLSQVGIIQEFVVYSHISDKMGSIYCFTPQTKEILHFIDHGNHNDVNDTNDGMTFP